MSKFVEVTILNDSSSPLVSPRKGLIRADRITSVIDISSGNYAMGAITEVTLLEPCDGINTDDEVGGVIHAYRQLSISESYEEVRDMLEKATPLGKENDD